MNVTINEHYEKLVKQKVETGRYTSSAEVIHEALRLLEERELEIEALRREIQRGLDSGDPLPGKQVFAELRQRTLEQLGEA